MRIAIFTDTFLPAINGVVTCVVNSAKELEKKGHEILIIAPKLKKADRYNLGKNIRVKLINSVNAYFYDDFRFTIPSTFRLIRELRRFKADIIHFHTPFTLGGEAIMCAKIMKKPLVGTFHTYISEPGYLKHIKLDNIKSIEKIAWKYSNFFYNRSNLVISPSKATKEILKKHKIKKEIMIVKNGLDLSKFREVDEAQKKKIRLKYGINDKTVLFVGRVSYEKSIGLLIRSMQLVFKKMPDAKLLVVGDGPLFNELKSKYDGKNIIFTGSIQHNELIGSGLISACSIFASMSKTENQPMTFLEAMAFGLPIVGVDKLGVPELIDGNGFIAPADDCKTFAKHIITLLKNKEFREKCGKESKRIIKDYSIDKTIDDLEKIYESLILKS